MVMLHSDRVYHSGDWQMTGLQMLSGTGGGKNGWKRQKMHGERRQNET